MKIDTKQVSDMYWILLVLSYKYKESKSVKKWTFLEFINKNIESLKLEAIERIKEDEEELFLNK